MLIAKPGWQHGTVQWGEFKFLVGPIIQAKPFCALSRFTVDGPELALCCMVGSLLSLDTGCKGCIRGKVLHETGIDAARSTVPHLLYVLPCTPGGPVLQVEPRVAGGNIELEGQLDHSLEPFRQACSSPFLVAGGHSRASAIAAINNGQAGEQLGCHKCCGGILVWFLLFGWSSCCCTTHCAAHLHCQSLTARLAAMVLWFLTMPRRRRAGQSTAGPLQVDGHCVQDLDFDLPAAAASQPA